MPSRTIGIIVHDATGRIASTPHLKMRSRRFARKAALRLPTAAANSSSNKPQLTAL
jgi:hypothetical protein